MTSFLIYELKVALLIIAFYACWRLLLANQTCYRQNRWILISSVVASFVLPFCKITIHKTVDITNDMEAAPVIANNALSGYSVWALVLVAIFIIGVILLMIKLALSLRQLSKLKQPSEIHQISEGHELAVCDSASQPFSWWNTVFLNRKDFEEGTTALLTHELGHIRLHHSLDVVLIELFTALQWFNPAMWMLRRDLRTIHEYEADQQVLSRGFNDIQYLNLLIRMAASQGGYSLANGISNKGLIIANEKFESAASGNGPVDAAIKALKTIIKRQMTLREFTIQAISKGSDDMGKVHMQVEYDGKVYYGFGANTDIVTASVEAYIDCINKFK